jgi:uncharacterized membrane protein YfcA
VSLLEALVVVVAGMAAGGINAVVGSGTLVTFPVLLAVGYSPVVANVSNNVGLVPGGLSGVHGYRRELEGQRGRALHLGAASLVGGVAGAVLLLVLPAEAFKTIVPGFIVLALLLILLQSRLARLIEARRRRERPHGGPAAWLGVMASGVYGGYFGAAQGILLVAVLGLALPEDLQRINALKNVLSTLVNFVAALIFVFAADVAWLPAGLIAGGSIVGGQLGARYGRRLPPAALRGVIVAVGVFAIVRLLTT